MHKIVLFVHSTMAVVSMNINSKIMSPRQFILSIFDDANRCNDQIDYNHHTLLGTVDGYPIVGQYTEGRRNATITPVYQCEAWDKVMEKIKASGFAYMPSKLDDGMMVLNIK